MSADNQSKTAEVLVNRIQSYLPYFEVGPKERKTIKDKMTYYKIATVALPFILTFGSAYAYIVTKEVLTLFTNLGNALPPIYYTRLQDEAQFYNTKIDIRDDILKMTDNIWKLARLGKLEENLKEVEQKVDELVTKIKDILKF